MSFFSLSSFKQKKAVTLVLHIDVGRGNCRGALISENNPPTMVYTSIGPEKASGNMRKSLSSTVISLRDVLEDISKFMSTPGEDGSFFKVVKVFAILAAPYYLSHTALIKYKEEKAFTVTPDLVAGLLKDYKESSTLKAEGHDEAEIGKNPKTLSEHVIEIKINGYHTSSPYGKSGKTLDLSVFKTEVSPGVVLSIERETRKYFSYPVNFEPLSLAVYVALRDHVHFDKDFIFVVVGAEVTEVSLVRGFTLLETTSFPFGKHSLVRHLSRELSSPEEMTSSELSMYGSGGMREASRARMNAALGTAVLKWHPFFEKALVSISDTSALPNSVYLVSDPDVKEVFEAFVKANKFGEEALTPTGLNTVPIDTEIVKSLMHFSDKASCDTILCLEGLFATSAKLPIDTIS